MMKLFTYPAKDKWANLSARPIGDIGTKEEVVKDILQHVKKQGDKALIELTKKFDKVSIKNLRLSESEITKAAKSISPILKKAIDQAYANIYKFHSAQSNSRIEKIETMKGITCWRKSVPIEKVGLYIPGGSAPLLSTVLMLGIPAKIAGCKEIILCSPTEINPAVLYAASKCGIKNVFAVGGAQAIAAMAFGTKNIPK